MKLSPVVCELTSRQAAKSCRSLLVISPNADRWASLSEYLEKRGWQVRVAASASKLESTSPCLVFIEALDHAAFVGSRASLLEQGLEDAVYCAMLPKAEVSEVLACIRQGASDVLVAQPTLVEMEEALERLSEELEEVLATRRALESSNHSLQESLNILRMDHIAGREVQRSMLPITPMEHGPYRIAHKIIPSLYLSGDFVGYNFLFNRYLLFYFADVSGHGASSAFITVLLRFHLNRIIRKHILEHDELAVSKAPDGLLESLNRLILSIEVDKHMTIFAGAIDMRRNILRYAGGAQMPPPVFVADGDARFVHGKGKPVGLFEDVEWPIYEIALPQKFVLTLVSDGALETFPGDGLMEKEEYLLGALVQTGGDFDRICDALKLSDVADVRDDMSILSISRGFTDG